MPKFSSKNQPSRKATDATAPGPTATVAIADTPEFKAAVQAAVDQAVGSIAMTLDKARQQAGTLAPGNSDAVFADKLAMAIAGLTHQGTGRGRPVAPDVLAARDAARDRMIEAISQARAKSLVPTYTLKNKVHLGEILIDPFFVGADHRVQKTEIDWDGIPNEAMVPHNEVAEIIYAEYRGWVGTQVVTPLDDMRGLSVTHGGLTIRGGSRAMKAGEAEHTGNGTTEPAEGLRIRRGDRVDGPLRFKSETRVLGTVHPPARQSA